MRFLLGQGKRRWRIVILTSIVAVPTIIITTMVLGSNDRITWSVVAGVLFFTVLGFDFYAIALAQFGGRFKRNDVNKKIDVVINKRLKILINEQRMLSSNVKLIVIASVCVAVFYSVPFYLYSHSSQNWLQVLLGVVVFFNSLVFVPILLFSLAFVSVEGLLRLISILVKIRSAYYWITILITWLTGGVFLLINAVCK